jgi:hypothetical protein
MWIQTLWYQRTKGMLKEKHATICHICIKCFVNTQHVVKTTGVISGEGINNHYGASESIHGLNRDCAVPFVVSCIVFCRSLFVLFLKTYSEVTTCWVLTKHLIQMWQIVACFFFQNQIDDDSTVLNFFDRGLMLWCLTPHSTIYRDD